MKKTCAKCYQKFEEEDVVGSFCVSCHKKITQEENKKDEERNQKWKKEKELKEINYSFLRAIFPYFITTVIISTLLLIIYWYKKIKEGEGERVYSNCD
jgi:hypothetical protein